MGQTSHRLKLGAQLALSWFVSLCWVTDTDYTQSHTVSLSAFPSVPQGLNDVYPCMTTVVQVDHETLSSTFLCLWVWD